MVLHAVLVGCSLDSIRLGPQGRGGEAGWRLMRSENLDYLTCASVLHASQCRGQLRALLIIVFISIYILSRWRVCILMLSSFCPPQVKKETKNNAAFTTTNTHTRHLNTNMRDGSLEPNVGQTRWSHRRKGRL